MDKKLFTKADLVEVKVAHKSAPIVAGSKFTIEAAQASQITAVVYECKSDFSEGTVTKVKLSMPSKTAGKEYQKWIKVDKTVTKTVKHGMILDATKVVIFRRDYREWMTKEEIRDDPENGQYLRIAFKIDAIIGNTPKKDWED